MDIETLTKTSAPGKIPDSPLFVAEINDPSFKLHGWVVIHSFALRGSCGGVRLYPDVCREEAELLAKAMTYKYSFYEVALGGAKAAVRLPFDLPLADRAAMLRKFGEHIAPLIKSRIYWPWTDMNSTSDDIMSIYHGAGVKVGTLPGNSAYFTALSTFSAVLAAAEYYRIAPEKCSITIEGLGTVGKYLAIEIDRWGGRLIGASTRIGAVADPKGLDIKEIIKASEKYNDSWVDENGNWEKISKEQLFSLPMKVHIPCARTHSLTETVATDLNCTVVVPAANVPCTPGGELKINEKGIRLLPDFIVNSGGVVGPGLENLGISDDEIRNLFFSDFKEMLARLLRLSDRNQTPATTLASLQSNKNFRKLWVSGRGKTARPVRKQRLFSNGARNRGILEVLTQRIHTPKRLLLKNRVSEIKRILNERFT